MFGEQKRVQKPHVSGGIRFKDTSFYQYKKMPSIVADPRSINISFIRRIENTKHDDIFSIVPHSDCDKVFTVAYRDGMNKIRSTNTINEYEVYDFLENMFTLLPLDEDPFRMIQITAPSFPPVLLKTESLTREEVRESIGSVVKNTLRNWPTSKHYTKAHGADVEKDDLNVTRRPTTRSMTRPT